MKINISYDLFAKWKVLIDTLSEMLAFHSLIILRNKQTDFQLLLSKSIENETYCSDIEKQLSLHFQAKASKDRNSDIFTALNVTKIFSNISSDILLHGTDLKNKSNKILGLFYIFSTEQKNLSDKDKKTFQTFQHIIEKDLSENFKNLEIKKKEEDEMKRLSQVVDQSANSILICNLDGQIEYINKRFCDLSQYNSDEIIGKSFDFLKSDKQNEKTYSSILQKISKGKPWRGELLNRKKNGDLFWENATASPLKYKNTKIESFVIIKEEITQHKKVELELKNQFKRYSKLSLEYKKINSELEKTNSELKESQKLLSKIAENFPNSFISIIEKDFTIGFTSGQEFITKKLNPSDFIGLNIEQVFGEHTKVVKEHYSKTFNGETTTFELFYDNEYQLYKTVPLANKKGEIPRILVVVENISESKNAHFELIKAKEKAEESDRLKTEFINNLSHEIRTPMNGIIGFTELLNSSNITDLRRQSYSSIIKTSVNQLLKIVDDILEISKLETNQVKVTNSEFNLNELLTDLFNVFDAKAKNNKTPLYLEKALSNSDSNIISDRWILSKILSKLIENALKFTSTGFIQFGYKIIDDDNRQKIQFFVKDTGQGIKKEKQHIIFTPFSHAEEQQAVKTGGLGLGLSIVKKSTKLIEGTISVDSEIGKGATFYITIPINKNSNKQKLTQ